MAGYISFWDLTKNFKTYHWISLSFQLEPHWKCHLNRGLSMTAQIDTSFFYPPVECHASGKTVSQKGSWPGMMELNPLHQESVACAELMELREPSLKALRIKLLTVHSIQQCVWAHRVLLCLQPFFHLRQNRMGENSASSDFGVISREHQTQRWRIRCF